MQVETYEFGEVAADGEPLEHDDESLQLIEQLGLEGQRKLIAGAGDEATRIPYRKMTKEESLVYEQLFTRKTPINDYADEPLPLRVLQVAAHAHDIFDSVVVWHEPNADINDPILVGLKEEEIVTEQFILARWGAALAPFSELKKAAGQVRRRELQHLAAQLQVKVTAFLNTVEACTSDEAALSIRKPHYYD